MSSLISSILWMITWAVAYIARALVVVVVFHVLACLTAAVYATISAGAAEQTQETSPEIATRAPSWWEPPSVGRMAVLLSRIQLPTYMHGKARLSIDEWMRPVTTVNRITASEEQLGDDILLPEDYKTFLLFIDEWVVFSYGSKATLHFRHAEALGWPDGEGDSKVRCDEFMHSLIGPDALSAIIAELGLDGYLNEPLRSLSLDHSDRIYLVKSEECRQIAGTCHALLSSTQSSDYFKYQATKYSAEHFGNVSFLKAMKSWPTWVIFEVGGGWDMVGPRIYPSFKEFLAELATRGEPGREMARASESAADKKERIALAERLLWEPVTI
ncbi:hypothetical protein GGS26DRAFT_587508 [Hypomontagnella submonticulosa]|nr:hypothetical protein GGS26DRAFT_587508 [Hypomontagnella submonticulosa]